MAKSLQEVIDALLEKALITRDSADALRYTQAAVNTAHIKHALADHNPKA